MGKRCWTFTAVCGVLYMMVHLGAAGSTSSKPHDEPIATKHGETEACDPQDFERCDTLCEKGSGDSCARLGVFYVNGHEVEKDKAYAAELYEQGCDLGSAEGCYNFYSAILYGVGVRADADRALKYAKKACDLGHEKSCLVIERNQRAMELLG